MMRNKILVVAAMALLAAVSFGQGGPQGGPGGGPGGPGFGPGGGYSGPSRLIMRKDVQTDLGLTDEQKTKIQALLKANRPSFGGPGGGGPGGGQGGDGGPGGDMGGPPDGGGPGGGGPDGGPDGGPGGGPGGGPKMIQGPGGDQGNRPDMAEMQKAMEAMNKKIVAGLKEILTADQWTRLKGISIQVNGNAVLQDEEVAKDLGLTDEQKTKVKTLIKNQSEANRSLFEKVMNGEIERDELQTKMKKNTETLKTLLGKVLTDDQTTKLKTLAGKPFKATETDGPRGRGQKDN